MGLQQDHGGGNKKLILAIETSERHGRPSCSECSDRLREQRGCFKPGYAIEGNKVFHFTSIHLSENDRALRECPVGVVLRETPYVYDAISAHSYIEAGSLNPIECPPWLNSASRVVSSERLRMVEQRAELARSRADASHSQSVLKSRKGGARV